MSKVILVGHGGSRNHGCEAIVRSTAAMINEDVSVFTSDMAGDECYRLNEQVKLTPIHDTGEAPIPHLYAAVARRLFGSYRPLIEYEYKDIVKVRDRIIIAVGGDNYCNGHPLRYVETNRLFSQHNRTVLWGCSITPELLEKREIIEDMNRYSLIVARESITYDALMAAGVKSKVRLFPDPAFTLKPQQVELPWGFKEGNTVGINLSPLVEGTGANNEAMRGITAIIEHIISTTDNQIALIPHVVWEKSDDMSSLGKLYDKYKDTGRVILVDSKKQLNCCQLKYIISKCSLFVTARTHASIAAYSSAVPVMVLGYSVKSRGIARDIFGENEGYVVSVDREAKARDIIEKYKLLEANCENVRQYLQEVIPEYVKKSAGAGKLLTELE